MKFLAPFCLHDYSLVCVARPRSLERNQTTGDQRTVVVGFRVCHDSAVNLDLDFDLSFDCHRLR